MKKVVAVVAKNPYIRAMAKRVDEDRDYQIDLFEKYSRVRIYKNYDTIYIYHIGYEALMASQTKHKRLIIHMSGVEPYVGTVRRITWENVDVLVGLQQHQIDYFKEHWGERCPLKSWEILNVPAIDTIFTLKDTNNINNNVAVVANLTGRKGEDMIPEFLRRYSTLNIHHIGKTCLYGASAEEFINWQVKRDNNEHRYKRYKQVPFGRMNEWLEDKTYLFHPSICEGFGRTIVECMTKGIKPIIRRYPGSEELWGTENTFDNFKDIDRILENGINPKKYKKYVMDKYGFDKTVEKFKNIL